VKLVFGEYLESRGYSEEAGFLYNAAGEVEKGLEAFKKSLNVDMCLSMAYENKFNEDQIRSLVIDLVEKLQNGSKFEQAGDLLRTLKDCKIEEVIDCYNKANKFLKSIEVATQSGLRDIINTQIKLQVKIAYDVKKN
jgi:tetratricopeptide (TPR) repeat protein